MPEWWQMTGTSPLAQQAAGIPGQMSAVNGNGSSQMGPTASPYQIDTWQSWGANDWWDPEGRFKWADAPEHFGKPWDTSSAGVPQAWEVMPQPGSPFGFDPMTGQWGFNMANMQSPYGYSPWNHQYGYAPENTVDPAAQFVGPTSTGMGNTTPTQADPATQADPGPDIWAMLYDYGNAVGSGDWGQMQQAANAFDTPVSQAALDNYRTQQFNASGRQLPGYGSGLDGYISYLNSLS